MPSVSTPSPWPSPSHARAHARARAPAHTVAGTAAIRPRLHSGIVSSASGATRMKPGPAAPRIECPPRGVRMNLTVVHSLEPAIPAPGAPRRPCRRHAPLPIRCSTAGHPPTGKRQRPNASLASRPVGTARGPLSPSNALWRLRPHGAYTGSSPRSPRLPLRWRFREVPSIGATSSATCHPCRAGGAARRSARISPFRHGPTPPPAPCGRRLP